MVIIIKVAKVGIRNESVTWVTNSPASNLSPSDRERFKITSRGNSEEVRNSCYVLVPILYPYLHALILIYYRSSSRLRTAVR